MRERLIKLPYNVDDRVFIVEDYNKYYDTNYTPIRTIYGSDIVIKPMIVDGFIVDDEGVHLAENGHDGWNKITVYHDLTLSEYGDCRIFKTYKEAELFVRSLMMAT